MTNKYISHGNTYNGDGTSKDAASSNGGVGAWNNINIFEGTTPTYGSLNDGDAVYIRSLDASDTAITRTLSAAVVLGSSHATVDHGISWLIDGGSTWSGINGTITYDANSSAGNFLTVELFNRIAAENEYKFKFNYNAADPVGKRPLVMNQGSVLRNAYIDESLKTGNGASEIFFDEGICVNCKFKVGRIGNAGVFRVQSYSVGTLINPDIELMSTTTALASIFVITGDMGVFNIYGGRIHGVGAIAGLALFKMGALSDILNGTMIGLQFPKVMDYVYDNDYGERSVRIVGIGLDNELGAVLIRPWGIADSRDDGNYPTLNATYPTSDNRLWSWKLYPASTDLKKEMEIAVSKLYTQAPATKTVTLEVLVADTMTYNKATLWIDVMYIDDSTGTPKLQTTKDIGGAALDSSTASWSSVSYGSIDLIKYKLSLVLDSNIKQNTLVTVVLRGLIKSSGSSDLLFVCPDVQLS